MITIGSRCNISPDAYIGFKEHGGDIVIGNDVTINHGCVIRSCTGVIIIASGTSIGYNTIIHGQGGIDIGNDVLISPGAHIYAQNHQFKKSALIKKQSNSYKGIRIAGDVWIGAGAIILDGVFIHKGSVIGAGAVVTKDVQQYEIWAGNPAKKIGDRK